MTKRCWRWMRRERRRPRAHMRCPPPLILVCRRVATPHASRRTDEAAEELESLLQEELLAGIPLLIFANKQDLLNAMSAGELMKELDLTSDKTRWTHIQACSAKTGEGLQEGISMLLENIKAKSE